MTSTSNAHPVNLALQGGGAHGAVTWGVVDRHLENDDIRVDSISVTIAGAVNATALAYGLHKGGPEGARETLDNLWREISRAGAVFSPVKRTPFDQLLGEYNLSDSFAFHAFEVFTRTVSPYQFNPFDINPLKDVLVKCINFESLRHCIVTRLYLSATNVRTGKVHVFRTGDACVEAVLASACLPFLFKAVEIDGEHYWDGGYMGNPVLYPFFYEADTSDVIIVHVNPLERDDVPKSTTDIFNRINEISFNSSLLRELRAISFVHKLIDDGWLKGEYHDRLRDVRIHSIRSDKSLIDLSVASKFSTDWAFLTELRDRGRRIADAWLANHAGDIGVRSSVNLRDMFSA